MLKYIFYGIIGLAVFGATSYLNVHTNVNQDVVYQQLGDNNKVVEAVQADHWIRNNVYSLVMLVYFFIGGIMILFDLKKYVKVLLPLFLLVLLPGCYRPFEPVQLETIGTSEEGFLIPLRGDKTQQTSTNSEADLKASLVSTKQVQIPQQWVPKGFETTGPNGEWKPAAILIRVDRAPVTREWTADPASGTSKRNEAIWVMTSDQVEFSTGWNITAYIANREDCIKFLHYYPAGSLEKVLDTEVRARIQSSFGLETTDVFMDELRKKAVPHINNVVKSTTEFFKQRGITITNLGITGGFVYKDKSVADTLVKVFNAEQDKNIAAAATATQEERNKSVKMEAEGKATALLLEKKAEADGIKTVADAKAYEISKAQENKELYLALKRVEVEQAKLKVWNGVYPSVWMGAVGNGPDLLLNVPNLLELPKK